MSDYKERIEKIKKFLDKRPKFTEECEVVYLMVEIRKIIELLELKGADKKNELRIYCDWALHANLYYEKTVSPLLDTFIKNINTEGEKSVNKETIKLNTLKNQLNQFLKNYISIDSIKNWSAFRLTYLNIIKRCTVYSEESLIRLEIEEIDSRNFKFKITNGDNKRRNYVLKLKKK